MYIWFSHACHARHGIGVALVMPYGPSGLPFQKFPEPVRLVVGKPVDMPRIPEPRQQDLQEHHGRPSVESLSYTVYSYCNGDYMLLRLFIFFIYACCTSFSYLSIDIITKASFAGLSYLDY